LLAKNRPSMVRGGASPFWRESASLPVQNFNTPRGRSWRRRPRQRRLISSVTRITRVDSVRWREVLSELAGKIDPEKLAAAARTAPVAWAQRLGYLLEHMGSAAKTPALKAYVREHAKQSTALYRKGGARARGAIKAGSSTSMRERMTPCAS